MNDDRPPDADQTGDLRQTRLRSLRRWNIGVGLAHLVQGIFILMLSNGFSIPVQGKVQDGPPGTPLTIDKVFFDLRFSVVIALFLFLAAADHLLMATPGVVDWYETNLRRGVNYARWIEYSVSASLMIVLIAMLPGITNLYALLAPVRGQRHDDPVRFADGAGQPPGSTGSTGGRSRSDVSPASCRGWRSRSP